MEESYCEIRSMNDIPIEQSKLEPHIDMKFDSIDEVREFYEAFSKQKGFGIRTRSNKSDYYSLVCPCEGLHKKKIGENEEGQNEDGKKKKRKKCSTARTDCQAILTLSKWKNYAKWEVINFNNDYNHSMVSPKSVSYLRCHKKMSVAAKSLVEKFNDEGLLTGKVAYLFKTGDMSFSDRDCWNHLKNLRRRNLDIGDAEAVFEFCKKKQVENPEFYYAIHLDKFDDRMVNFFELIAPVVPLLYMKNQLGT